MKFHDTLNEKIWDLNTNDMLPEVKEKLKEIADEFVKFLEIPEDAVLDKVITGSSASYNYNKYSDLDLHIIVDYDKVHEDCPLVSGYLNSLKKQFNDNHDIFIHGIPVELYAEQKDQGTVHNGLYSLNTGWIDKPQKIEPTDNDAAVEAKFNEIKELVDKCEDSEEAQELIDKIYNMRKAGLSEAGEFCTENLAFKKLRIEGCMEKLRKIKKEQIDKQLSLESYKEELSQSGNCLNEDQTDDEINTELNNMLVTRYPIFFRYDNTLANKRNSDGYFIEDFRISCLPWDKKLYIKLPGSDVWTLNTPKLLKSMTDAGFEYSFNNNTNVPYHIYTKHFTETEFNLKNIIKSLQPLKSILSKIDRYLNETLNKKIKTNNLKLVNTTYKIDFYKNRFLTFNDKFYLYPNDHKLEGVDNDYIPIDRMLGIMGIRHSITAAPYSDTTTLYTYDGYIFKSVTDVQKYIDMEYERAYRNRESLPNTNYRTITVNLSEKDVKRLFAEYNNKTLYTNIVNGWVSLSKMYWGRNINSYTIRNMNKNESIKESLQSEYKQAFDLLIEGENIVGTLDTAFGKQFVKDVENLYKLKSYKLKLSVAKEMLKDIQGYLVDEQYDNYNAKIDKFMNNSKNESVDEESQLDKETELAQKLLDTCEQMGFEVVQGRFDWIDLGNGIDIEVWTGSVNVVDYNTGDEEELPLETEEDLQNILNQINELKKNESIKESEDELTLEDKLINILTKDGWNHLNGRGGESLEKDNITISLYVDSVIFNEFEDDEKELPLNTEEDLQNIIQIANELSNKNESIKESEELKVGDIANWNNVVWVKINSIDGNKANVSPIHQEDIDSGRFEKEEIVLLDSLRKSNESIKEEFFVGNDKYIIVPVSYAYNDIRILNKKTGEFLKDENGDNLKFSTEEECGNYIKSLDEDLTILEETLRKAEGMKKDIKEEQEKISLQDINNWFESKTLLGKQDDPEFYIRSAVRKWPQLKGHEKELRDNLAKEKAKNHPWYPYEAMVTNTLAQLGLFEPNKNESIEEISVDEDVDTLEKKMDDVDTTLKDLMDKINGMSEEVEDTEFDIDKANKLIDEALKED